MNTELIEKLKENWTAWGGLSEEERECLKENWSDVIGHMSSAYPRWCPPNTAWLATVKPEDIFRISPDFQPEKKRWFFQLDNHRIVSPTKGLNMLAWTQNVEKGIAIEVQESELPYLEKPEGEWVFKRPQIGESFKEILGDVAFCVINYLANEDAIRCDHLSNYRWVKVKAEPRFVKYPIHIEGNHYFCEIEHTEATLYLLSELPSIVGFAGVQFKGGHPDEWSMSISQTVSGYSSTNDPKQKPATPIWARFYVEDSNA